MAPLFSQSPHGICQHVLSTQLLESDCFEYLYRSHPGLSHLFYYCDDDLSSGLPASLPLPPSDHT